VNAPKLFEQMLKDQIAPALRELGMRGSGQHFRVPNDNGDFAQLGFQKASGNTANVCRFTVNTAFYGGQTWQQARDRESWLPAAPTATSIFPVEGWQQRVGFLMESPHDHWWTIRTAEDVPAIADHVIALVRDAVLPQLRARLAGSEPPPQPSPDTGPAQDCPWPSCTYDADLGLDGFDLDLLGSVTTVGLRGSVLDAAEQDLLDRARRVSVPRTQAWKVLHISRARLDTYADRIEAGPTLTFVQLLTVSLLSTDDALAAYRWPEAAEAVAAWAEQLPAADPEAALVVSEDAVAVLSFTTALAADAPASTSVVQLLMDATQYLLGELNSTGVV
jgi:hypothetical protein